MNITIYSTSTCATCHLVTSWLESHSIAYKKLNTDEDDAAMQEFMSVNDGVIGVPFTVFTDEQGQQTKILGFDHKKFKAVLGL